MFPKRLVFCGGGTRCLVFLQSLLELEQRGRLVRVNEWWGTSAGALLASLYSLTRSVRPLKDIMFSANYLRFRDFDITNILSIHTTWGLDDGKSLHAEIERLFELVEVGSKAKCMKDAVGLNIVVSDLTDHTTVVCNSNTFPNMRIVDALRASMSLPLYFRPYVHPESGHYWVDGAIRANFPWNILPSDDARREALGFAIEKSWMGGPRTFSEYIFSMIHFDEPKKIQRLRETWPRNILWFASPPYPAWYVRLVPEDYTLIERMGKDAFDAYWAIAGDSEPTPRTTENPSHSAHPHTPLQDGRSHHTDERSETLQSPSLETPRRSSSPHMPSTSPAFRRWSV